METKIHRTSKDDVQVDGIYVIISELVFLMVLLTPPLGFQQDISKTLRIASVMSFLKDTSTIF